jgi:hypothetical protein
MQLLCVLCAYVLQNNIKEFVSQNTEGVATSQLSIFYLQSINKNFFKKTKKV